MPILNIEYKKIVKVDELAFAVPRKAGATFSQLWHIFYYTRMFKYINYRHYIEIKKAFNKICTYKNLQAFCRLGYLKSPQHEVYCATDKVLPILREAGFNTDILPVESVGVGNSNELNNTDLFVKALKVPDFYALLYNNFGYLIPDALLLQRDEKHKKYKLTFLEIEAKKPDWQRYIENKRDSYLKLAKDIQFYNYWVQMCTLLKIKPPKQSDLKFSVMFICSIKRDFGKGFSFIESLPI